MRVQRLGTTLTSAGRIIGAGEEAGVDLRCRHEAWDAVDVQDWVLVSVLVHVCGERCLIVSYVALSSGHAFEYVMI